MPTIQQLVRSRRIQIKKKTKSPALVDFHKDVEYVHGFIQRHLKNQILQLEKLRGYV